MLRALARPRVYWDKPGKVGDFLMAKHRLDRRLATDNSRALGQTSDHRAEWPVGANGIHRARRVAKSRLALPVGRGAGETGENLCILISPAAVLAAGKRDSGKGDTFHYEESTDLPGVIRKHGCSGWFCPSWSRSSSQNTRHSKSI